MKRTTLFALLLGFFLTACTHQPVADHVFLDAQIFTADTAALNAEALAIAGDRILYVGDREGVQPFIGDSTQVHELKGAFLMPGFIEGHGHFSSLGNSLMNLNFMNSRSWEEIVAMVADKVKESKPGDWITGRGWHQEKWEHTPEHNVLGYPFHDALSAVSPDNPVLLRHASGHSLFANKAAMDAAGVSRETPDPQGGEIVRDASGEPIGVFEERAMGIISRAYNEWLNTLSDEERLENWKESIRLAEEECLAKGVTSFHDAGSPLSEVERYRELAENGELDVRLWVMIRQPAAALEGKLDEFPLIDVGGEHFLTVRAIKAAVDGALGSFGAWLLEPYNDKPNFTGQNTTPLDELERLAELCLQHDLQFCTHAIGDRANREMLDLYERIFQAHPEKTDLRWRIEHAQHLHPDDIPRFARLGVIAAMQGIHCTSDAPFVEKRLGYERAENGAYPWRSLIDSGAIIANGTDAPVEDVDPIESFYASVTRKRADDGMEFFPEQAMTRTEALLSYTINCAYAAFEEDLKGSLTPGKLADFVVLSNNLLTCPEEEILQTEVLQTWVGGELKWEKGE